MSLIIKELLSIAEARLSDAGCMDSKVDARILLCNLLRKDKIFLFTHMGEPLDDHRCELYFDLIDVRASRKPLQYILESQDFMGLRFKVNEHVLIPRQDTETLVEHALDYLKKTKPPMGGFDVLDLCCGSGAISVSLAYYLEKIKIKVVATDLSAEALAVAKENAAGYKPSKSIQFLQGNLFEPFPKDKKGRAKKQFDLIISNPPYIRSDVIPTLQAEVAEFEPRMALDGGTDGLDLYRKIAMEAPAYLKKSGVLMLEIGCDQGEGVTALLKANPFFGAVRIEKDLAGLDRVVIAEATASSEEKKAIAGILQKSTK